MDDCGEDDDHDGFYDGVIFWALVGLVRPMPGSTVSRAHGYVTGVRAIGQPFPARPAARYPEPDKPKVKIVKPPGKSTTPVKPRPRTGK